MKRGAGVNGSLLVLLFFCVSVSSPAQKKWDGGGADNQWVNPLNWDNDIAPLATESILLDNSFISVDYNVVLPLGAGNTTVAGIRIVASSGNTIQLAIPAGNTAVPALTLSGTQGLQLESGSVFINSSGASSGTVMSIIDSIYIFNNARFVQNSRTAHATYVSKLSRRPGTEKGIFEFNVPGAASYTISLAGRTYGSFELSAQAAGGTKTYLSNGATNAMINGNLRIGAGATYALDFTGELNVKNDLIVEGVFNLASSLNNNVLKLAGNLNCAGTITETNNGLPVIDLMGSTLQSVWQNGTIINQITIRTDNPSGIQLRTLFSIPYLLQMIAGKIFSYDTATLVLANGSSIIADSALPSCFVDGPLRKNGLLNQTHFLFPVGKGTVQRWVELKNATGDFKVEFFKQSPTVLSGALGVGIDHVSRIEYWSVESSIGATANVELSFNDVNSGGVSDLSTLRVAQLRNSVWEDAGNSAITGSAGAAGSVLSLFLSSFEVPRDYFSLASSNSFSNPLPVRNIPINSILSDDGVLVFWTIQSPVTPTRSELFSSVDGINFVRIISIETRQSGREYRYLQPLPVSEVLFYRVKTLLEDGTMIESATTRIINRNKKPITLTRAIANGSGVLLGINSSQNEQVEIMIFNSLGQMERTKQLLVIRGSREVFIDMNIYRAGHYYVILSGSRFRSNLLRFSRK